MLWCGKGGNDNVVFNLKEISDLGLANVMRMIGEGVWLRKSVEVVVIIGSGEVINKDRW